MLKSLYLKYLFSIVEVNGSEIIDLSFPFNYLHKSHFILKYTVGDFFFFFFFFFLGFFVYLFAFFFFFFFFLAILTNWFAFKYCAV